MADYNGGNIGTVGTGPGNIVALNGSSQLPAVSGALLANLPAGATFTLAQVTAAGATTTTAVVLTGGATFGAAVDFKLDAWNTAGGSQRFNFTNAADNYYKAGGAGGHHFRNSSDSDVFVIGQFGALTVSIPTSDPHVIGQLWSNLGIVTVSAG